MSVLLGTVIGLMAAMIKLNADRKKKETVLSRIIHIYVDVIRGTPSVLQLMIVYFAVFHSRLGYVAAVVSFGINSGAYVSEVIRAGIMAVDKGQQEAGRSLGLGYKDDDDKIRLNQRKPSKYKGLSRFGPEKNLQRINKFMKERPIFYKNLIQMKENFRFYLRCFYCITKVVILQFNSENRTELARNG